MEKGKEQPERVQGTNAFERVDIPRYYVPMTRWGPVALTLGLTIEWLIRLPDPWQQSSAITPVTGIKRKFQLKVESL